MLILGVTALEYNLIINFWLNNYLLRLIFWWHIILRTLRNMEIKQSNRSERSYIPDKAILLTTILKTSYLLLF